LSFKRLFSRSLGADPERLHMAAHSHHLWPDSSFDGQVECWNDAARLADRKWDRIMDEVWPEAQGHVTGELGTHDPDSILFAPNTHELLVRLVAAAPRQAGRPLRVLTSDGEFHSARR
jgi:selenocysteine lyase/cysteine desulfurase